MAITRRRLITGAGAILSGFGGAGLLPFPLAAAAPGAAPIVLGILSDASGEWARYGKAEQRGIRLAIDRVNAASGVLGRRIEPRFADTQTRPDAAARAARQLIERNDIAALIGGVSSALSNAIAEVAEEHGVVYLDTNSRSPSLSADHCVSVRFTFAPDTTRLAKATVANVQRIFGDRWYLVYEDSVWGLHSAQFRRTLVEAAGGIVVGEAVVSLDGSNLPAIAERIAGAGVDAVSVFLGPGLLAQTKAAVRARGIEKQPAWVLPMVDWPDTVKMRPRDLFGVFPVTWYWHLQTAGVPEFVKAFWRVHPKAPQKMPGNLTHNGYMAARALFSAIAAAGGTDTDALVEHLEGMKFSPRERAQHGPAWIDADSHTLQQPIYLASANPDPVRGDDLFRILTWTNAEDLYDPTATAACRVVDAEI